jgi:stage V sporulation protein G
MKISKITVKKVIPKDGLVGFTTIVMDNCLYLGNIAIFSRLNKPGEYRLVFPEKKIGEKKISLFYPLTTDFYFLLEKAVIEEMNKDNFIQDKLNEI